jgi:hypothetical protein
MKNIGKRFHIYTCMQYNCNGIQIQGMTKNISFLLLFIFSFLAAFSQSNTDSAKECRFTSGIGFGGATNHSKSPGREAWLQLDYKMNSNISVAMEFENMSYRLIGYYPNMPDNLNGINVVGNNFSLLLKYHIQTRLPLQLAVGSGWTYFLKTSEYYYYENPSAMQYLNSVVGTVDSYEIPLLMEIGYPIWKAINVQARVKCNLATQQQSTYSSGIALSLRL